MAELRKRAWRCPPSAPQAKEFTKIFHPGDSDLAPAIAEWEDGFKHEVSNLTTKALQSMEAAEAMCNKRARKACILFEGKTDNGKEIHVKEKKDLKMLVCIFEDKKQVLQVTMELIEHKETYHEIAKTIVEQHCKAIISKQDMQALRNKLLEQNGLPLPKSFQKPSPVQKSVPKKKTCKALGAGGGG